MPDSMVFPEARPHGCLQAWHTSSRNRSPLDIFLLSTSWLPASVHLWFLPELWLTESCLWFVLIYPTCRCVESVYFTSSVSVRLYLLLETFLELTLYGEVITWHSIFGVRLGQSIVLVLTCCTIIIRYLYFVVPFCTVRVCAGNTVHTIWKCATISFTFLCAVVYESQLRPNQVEQTITCSILTNNWKFIYSSVGRDLIHCAF